MKCSGGDICTECGHLNIRCAYTPRAPKLKTRSRRGAVISQFKQSVAQSTHPPTTSTATSTARKADQETNRDAGLKHTKTFFLDLIPNYEASVFPPHPIIHSEDLRKHIERLDDDQESKAFVYAAGAVSFSLSPDGKQWTPQAASQTRDLIDIARSLCRPVDVSSKSSVIAIMTALFIHHCLYDLGEPQSAFLYARHALSMLELLRIRETAYDTSGPQMEGRIRRRLYWLLFIQERFLAISEYKNTVLLPLPFIDEQAPDLSASIDRYFSRLIKLFTLVDTTFVHGWLTQNNESNQHTISADWVKTKSREILRDAEEAEHDRDTLDSMQLADLTITRHWLATHVWRIAMSTGHLRSLASEESMSLFFPVQLADRLRQEVTTYSFESIEIHGTGIAQKLFELSDTLADLVLHVPAASLGEYADHIDLLVFLLRVTFRSAMLDGTRKAILEDKLHRIYSLDHTTNDS